MKTVFRADASTEFGAGHVMRCLALGQMIGMENTLWLQAETSDGLIRRLEEEGAQVEKIPATRGTLSDADSTLALAQRFGSRWIVADGYCFDTAWQKRIKDAGSKLLLLDDYGHANHYHADLVLNQNGSVPPTRYASRDTHTRLLLGSQFILLRREFIRADKDRPITKDARRVLVTFGGGDHTNQTCAVLRTLSSMPMLECIVVAGSNNPHLTELRALVSAQTDSMRLVVDAANMPELMRWADLAVSAAGSTAWEFAYCGLPAILVPVAPNQSVVVEYMRTEGVGEVLLPSEIATLPARVESLLRDPKRRDAMRRKGQDLVDGLGAARVVTHLRAADVNLRKATPKDRELYFRWANDPEVRRSALSTKDISWESHCRWFEDKLNDPISLLYLAQDERGSPLGQIRFDFADREHAEIDVSIESTLRGSGVGSALICRGVNAFFEETGLSTAVAHVRTENSPSQAAFENAGFRLKGTTELRGCRVNIFTLSRHE
ncbi:MAG: UDP-2,4-diacetamido-2,4,6-trideoxy-beta-L-altropyranose hydrolase [Verrucomicrobia bacterium]|nr:UDP-2,4-diacetamido-2,4,6-trideoxy-beta-L-altropyranose hydrolase [Verrucomicrobiota bacterium]